MRLPVLIKSLQGLRIKGIACDSKRVLPGFAFVAIKGSRADGHRFIPEAISRGARVIVAQKVKCKTQNIPFVLVKDTREALAELAAEFYGHPSKKIKVVGITGTNGKTTITYLIEAILKTAGRKPAVIGTVNYRFAGKSIPSSNTTPGPLELQSLLARMQKKKTDYAVMEVSSHALDQGRTRGVKIHSAIFTNLTQDHLDYHHNLNNYFLAKAKLFRGLERKSFCLINHDDPWAGKLIRLTRARVITYGLSKKAEVRAEGLKLDISGTEFTLIKGRLKEKFRIRLIGIHNVYNVLAAIAWALEEKIDLALVKKAVEEFRQVPGRLQRIDTNKGFSVFVDYAHTEDALKNVLESLREVSGGRIIVVFGCGGERDKTKRPKMGRVVSELADYALITSDNPRSEKPLAIIHDILKGIRKNNYSVIAQRQAAIKKSLSMARAGDIVLLAGKGHENYQVLKNKTIPFNDSQVARACLN